MEEGKVFDIKRYPYVLFNSNSRYNRSVSPEKTFYYDKECNTSFYYSLINEYHDWGVIKVPLLLGFKEGSETISWCEWACNHLLIAGKTGSGKTCALQAIIICLLHYTHPEYLRLCVLDAKSTLVNDLKGVCTVAQSDEDIKGVFINLYKEMRSRLQELGAEGAHRTIQNWNDHVYFYDLKGRVMPYIIVIFDEFGAFFTRYKKDKELLGKVRQLLSQSRSAGIIFCFATQTTYTKYLDGDILANFEDRMAFRLKSEVNGRQILGPPNSNDMGKSVASLKTGECYRLENDRRIKHTYPFVGEDALRNAVKNWKRHGLDWSLK